MTYSLLKLLHILGAVLMSSGLIGVWLAELRSRQVTDLASYAESIRYTRVFYDALTLPGALLILASGGAMVALFYGGNLLQLPWLMGMILLFLFEFIEGNTVTRLSFRKLSKLTDEAIDQGQFTPQLLEQQQKSLPAFTHFLDLPLVTLLIMLGVLRPQTWDLFIAGTLTAMFVAGSLTYLVPQMFKTRKPAFSNTASLPH